ncbi:MAG: sugar ABC transporter permease, partial [Mycobacteriales bacterium]
LAGPARAKHKKSLRSRPIGFLFVLPWILGLLLFYVGPMLATLWMSFTNYKYSNRLGTPVDYVGFKNWSRVFDDPLVAIGAKVTLRFAAFFIPLSMILPLAVAYLLTSKHLWGRGFFRAMFFLPAVVPAVSGLFIWSGYLNSQDGWLNRLLGVFKIPGPEWATNPTWVLPSYALIATWGVGNAVLIFISALNGVPKDLYEAGRLDGAGSWHLFRNVTWPMISPITFYNLVITLVALGQYFIVPFILTRGTGEPDNAASFYTVYFYKESFNNYDAGYGAALAWLMFIVIISITGLLFWSQRFWVHYEFQENK